MLTGTAGQDAEIKIAAGAKVFLNNVTINVPNNDGHRYSALACEGNATIILYGNNNLWGGAYASGLQAGSPGTTLTIKGSGTLTARGRDRGACIGSVNTAISGYVKDCGNIVIEGGTIIAYGGSYGAAIGGALEKNCGNITISGGTVYAKGGVLAAGIGCGVYGGCGDITITSGVTHVEAVKGDDNGGHSAPCSIGYSLGEN